MSFPSKIKTYRKTTNNLGNKVIIFLFKKKKSGKRGTTLEHRKHTRETSREKDANSIALID